MSDITNIALDAWAGTLPRQKIIKRAIDAIAKVNL